MQIKQRAIASCGLAKETVFKSGILKRTGNFLRSHFYIIYGDCLYRLSLHNDHAGYTLTEPFTLQFNEYIKRLRSQNNGI